MPRLSTAPLAAARHEQTAALLAAGAKIKEIAARLGLSYFTVRRHILLVGLPMPTRGGRRGLRDENRAAAIIARREAGETYQEIAGDYGITRERVRQIIKKAGRLDLGKDFAVATGLYDGPLVTWTCKGCGKTDERAPSKAQAKYCSADCRSIHNDRYWQMLRWRQEGLTWKEIAARRGIKSWKSQQHDLKRWAKRNDIELPIFRPGPRPQRSAA